MEGGQHFEIRISRLSGEVAKPRALACCSRLEAMYNWDHPYLPCDEERKTLIF